MSANGSSPRPPKTKQAAAPPKAKPFNEAEQLAMAKALRKAKKPKDIDGDTESNEAKE